MPLCTPKAMLEAARAGGFAVASFNIFNMESALAFVAAAEAENAPVMLQVWSGFAAAPGLELLGAIGIAVAKKAAVPVAVHLDHGETLSQVGTAVAAGFTSVMLDASASPLAENIARTKQVADFCRAMPTTVEGEIGHVGGGELGSGGTASAYTDPDEAARFYEETGVDFVAVSIGTTHGNYSTRPTLDIPLLRNIAAKVPAPLVMHGSSYTPDDQLAEAARNGISKINVATELSDTFIKATLDALPGLSGAKYANQLTDGPTAAMTDVARHKINLFGGAGKAALL